jgi:tight adherence protein C
MNNSSLEALINLLMLSALFAFLAIWWLAKRGGYRGQISERVRLAARSNRISEQSEVEEIADVRMRSRMFRKLAKFGDRLPLFDAAYREKLRQQMRRGGFRSDSAVSALLAIKFVVGVVCAALMVMFGANVPVFGPNPFFRGLMMLAVFIVGMIIPEYLLGFRSARRRRAMSACLPDALDLLVICTNAGNSLPVSIRRVADELESICPPLAGEFSLAADELQLSGDSTRALHGLAERIDLPSIRALISTLTQSMRYGTPITQALKTLSRTERVAHVVSLEEKAAKLAPKMVVPMMVFILPAVVAIAAGPAVIQLLDYMAKQ